MQNLHEMCQILFSEEKKKKENYHELVVCWICPEIGKA